MRKTMATIAVLMFALGSVAGAEEKKSAKADPKAGAKAAEAKGKRLMTKGAQANMAAQVKQNEAASNAAKTRHETEKTAIRGLAR